jgi:hypothetical protein
MAMSEPEPEFSLFTKGPIASGTPQLIGILSANA